jgi:hypothetical protein
MAEKEKKHKSEHKHTPAPKGRGKTHEMHIRKADSGGYSARHEMMPDELTGKDLPEQEHLLPDLQSLHDHIDNHFGENEEGGEPGSPSPSPTPAA